jgi:hypothetical protein
MSEDEAPLPPVHIADVDEDTVRALFFDVESLGTRIEIVMKHAAEGHVDARHRPTLAEAFARLRSGTAMGVQLRYQFQGVDWRDTLMRTADGFRLVRIST